VRAITLLLLAALPLLAASPDVKVRIRGTTASLPLERYVAAVLAGESSVFQSREALKAMAVAARTYAVRMRGRHASEGFDLCDTTHCQRLDLDAITPRLESAAGDTAGELLWFEGKPAFTPYTRDCGGRTEDASAIWPDMAEPYLKSHEDTYCKRAGTSAWQWNGDPRQILEALESSQLRGPHALDGVSILNRTASGRASTLLLRGGNESIRISASSFRFAVGRDLGWNTLRGDRYEVRYSNGRFIFEGSGAGHGVGLCQTGAEQMGLASRSYREILAYYYPGTVVGLTGRGLPWQRLRGEVMSLTTTQPDQDRPALALAEKLARALAQRTHWAIPPDLELRIYPDLDTFRNATGEPGWVAAHTAGRRIHLQPVAVLRSRGALESTLSHELVHVLMEAQAGPALPLWFREGLAAYLEKGRGTGTARIPSEDDLRQTSDPARARRAYADAAAMAASLGQHYGESAVLDWVKRGVPPEVTKASTSHAATNSK
jgi:stage II sporulation protein D